MKQILLAVTASLMMASAAHAGIIGDVVPSTTVIEGVAVTKTATLNVEKAIPVSIVGAGLRKKKVIIPVKVYVAEVLSTNAATAVRTDDGILTSVASGDASVVRLNFLRGVDAPTVQTSFREALEANSVNINDPSIAQFLADVSAGGDAASGKTITVATTANTDGTDSVYYEDTNGKSSKVVGPKGFGKNILSIWLGVPADDGLKAMKADIVKGL
jgi:hypothetical protein